MKDALTKSLLAILLLLPFAGFAQQDPRWQLMALGGVFSPTDDEIQNVYGTPVTIRLAVTAPLGEHGRMRISGSYLNQGGDPFYRSPDFFAGDASQLSLRGVSFTLETRARATKTNKLYFGAGVDYVFGREKITGIRASTGQAVGGHLVITPEVALTETIALTGEVSYQFLRINFKSGRNRYRFNLSGARLLAGLAFQVGR